MQAGFKVFHEWSSMSKFIYEIISPQYSFRDLADVQIDLLNKWH